MTGRSRNREPDRLTDESMDSGHGVSGEGGGLRRWSERKRLAKQDASTLAEHAGAKSAVSQTPSGAHDTLDEQADAPVLPPIDSLDEHSDYRGFMSDKVSEALRLQALRKLFSLPQFNIRDGLNDYDEDFSTFRSLGDIIPHDMARGIERALKKAADSQSVDRGGETACGQKVAGEPAGVAEPETQPEQDTRLSPEGAPGEALHKG
jgi:hypothetical protein